MARKVISRKDEIKNVCQAHTALNVFAIIVSILEGGHLYGGHSQRAASRIIKICKEEQQRRLDAYDAAVDVLNDVPVTPGASEAFDALSIADGLIERGYGEDIPQHWHDTIHAVAKARASKRGA